jgi:hypothetical protein
MRFVAVDLETTGLCPKTHGVIEFGAVFADLANSFAPKWFQCWVIPHNFTWDSYCLMLHAKLIQEIDGRVKDKDPFVYKSLYDVGIAFRQWLHTECGVPLRPEKEPNPNFQPIESVVGAGKNFGSFDLQFLLRVESFRNVFKHRSLDPTAYYIKPEDPFPPDLKECKLRAGFISEVAHRGLADAWDIVDLLQKKFKQ